MTEDTANSSQSVQQTLTGDEAKAEAVEAEPEDLPEWEICIRAYGPDDEPGKARSEHYHPRAKTEDKAVEKAVETATGIGIDAIVGTTDAYDVVDIFGPYDPDEIATDGGEEGNMSDGTDSDADGEWVHASRWAGLSKHQVWKWICGTEEDRVWKGPSGPKELEMEATPYGWQTGGPPYHTLPVPSPMLVPRPLCPVWALFYYLPVLALRRLAEITIELRGVNN